MVPQYTKLLHSPCNIQVNMCSAWLEKTVLEHMKNCQLVHKALNLAPDYLRSMFHYYMADDFICCNWSIPDP